jgi:hypothetical protein
MLALDGPLLVLRPPLWRRLDGIGIALPWAASSSNFEYVPRRLGVLNSLSSSSARSFRLMLAEWPCMEPPIEERGLPIGVLVPVSDVRDAGRGIMSVRDGGRAYDETLARELGRLISESGPRLGRGPNDRRLTPEVLSRGTWLPFDEADACMLVGVVSSPATEEAVDPTARLRDRIVTVEGTCEFP